MRTNLLKRSAVVESMPTGFAAFTTLVGPAVVGHLCLCWTGRIRSWVRGANSTRWVLGIGPGFGLVTLGFGLIALLGEPVGLALGSLLVVAGFAVFVPGLLPEFRSLWAHELA
jgi:hypothetical protein